MQITGKGPVSFGIASQCDELYRDHSTVMYSVTNVEEKMKENRELREELEALRGLINEM